MLLRLLLLLRQHPKHQFENTVKNGMDIINHLFNDKKLHNTLKAVNKWQSATGYYPDRIKNQKAIVSTLYAHNKYYFN